MAQTGSAADILAGLQLATQAAGEAGRQKIDAKDQRARQRASALEGLLGIGAAARQEEQLRQAKLAEMFNQEATKKRFALEEKMHQFDVERNIQGARIKADEMLHASGIYMDDPMYGERREETVNYILKGGKAPSYISKAVDVRAPGEPGVKTSFLEKMKVASLGTPAGLATAGTDLATKGISRLILGPQMTPESASEIESQKGIKGLKPPKPPSFLREVLGVKKGAGVLPPPTEVTFTPSGPGRKLEEQYLFEYKLGPDQGGKDYETLRQEIAKDGSLPVQRRSELLTALGAAELERTKQTFGLDGALDVLLSKLEGL